MQIKIEKADVVKCIILSIVTCGVYYIIWATSIVKDIIRVKNEKENEKEKEDGTLEIALMILFAPLGFYLVEKKFCESCQARGIPHKDNSVLYLVLSVFALSIINYYLMQTDLNKIADYYGVPQYGMPQQPQYGAPQQPPYGMPQQPQNGAPQRPPYSMPQQPQFGAPQQPPYGMPQQPQNGAPQQPPYGMPQQPQNGAPQQAQPEANQQTQPNDFNQK